MDTDNGKSKQDIIIFVEDEHNPHVSWLTNLYERKLIIQYVLAFTKDLSDFGSFKFKYIKRYTVGSNSLRLLEWEGDLRLLDPTVDIFQRMCNLQHSEYWNIWYTVTGKANKKLKQ